MAEKNKAQLLEEIEQLKAQIAKMESDAGITKAIEEKKAELEAQYAGLPEMLDQAKSDLAERDDKIKELSELLDKANDEISEQKDVIEELSVQNAISGTSESETIVVEGKQYLSIAKKFHMDGSLVTIEILKKDSSKAAKALSLGLLKEKEDKK